MAAVARNRALVAVQRALKRQSLGGKDGRFAVSRTLEHLKGCNVRLGENVQSISVNLAGREKDNYGAKRFLYENVPQLKYRNPHIQISRSKKQTGSEGEVTIKFTDGKEEQILTVQKTPAEIMEKLVALSNSEQTLNTEQMDKSR